MIIEKLENITSGISTALPTSSGNNISYSQAVNYLTYKINECVDVINRIDPEIYTKEIDTIKEELEAVEKSIDEKTEDINTINGKIDSINLSIDALNEALGHKVSHTNSTSVVYANNASGAENPIKFTSEADAGTIALRTSTGQLATADATEDNHAVGYKQMKNYVDDHSHALAYHKLYTNLNSKNTYNITDSEDILVLNSGAAHLIVCGWVSYSSGSDYISVDILMPSIDNTFYNPKIEAKHPVDSATGVSIGTISINVVPTTESISVTMYVGAGSASVTRIIDTIEIIEY